MSSTSSREAARQLDLDAPLASVRHEFVIPTMQDIASSHLPSRGLAFRPRLASAHGDIVLIDIPESTSTQPGESCVYLCGNSLGLQPKRTATRIRQYLDTWGSQGVQGHFKPLEDSPLPTWLHADARAAEMMAPIVGAHVSEVAVMQTLTANLHFLMSAFYRPTKERHKIILESKAFPSDHFAVETQIRHHGFCPDTSMVTITSPTSEDNVLSTQDILSTISTHASTTALILLPGIQYYTGQLLDIPTITAFAHQHSIFIVWDLAHAAGNVPLSLHNWDVDAAVWCTYKYINGGPGCIGGMFIHTRNSQVKSTVSDDKPEDGYANRLAGWWGNDKSTRFVMATKFHPVGGAAGFQLSNPSVLDITSLCASLEVFELAGGIEALRRQSLRLTAYLEALLKDMNQELRQSFCILTPEDPEQRGAQLSLRLADGLLETVMKELEVRGVIVDDRKPNVVRVAPAPLYNTFEDCFAFVEAFASALEAARDANTSRN